MASRYKLLSFMASRYKLLSLFVIVTFFFGCGRDTINLPSNDESGLRASLNQVIDVTVDFPNGGEILSWREFIEWTALHTNPFEAGFISVRLEYSHNGGDTWTIISDGEQNDGRYTWMTESLPVSQEYLLRVTATDTSGHTDSDVSDAFFAKNDRILIRDLTAKQWDITYAVETHGMVPENWWFGLGPHAFQPIMSPPDLLPGEDGYPSDDDSFEVVATTRLLGGPKAYPLPVMQRHETLNDYIGDFPFAVLY